MNATVSQVCPVCMGSRRAERIGSDQIGRDAGRCVACGGTGAIVTEAPLADAIGRPVVKLEACDVYGRTLFYPANATARRFAELCQAATLTVADLARVADLGFAVSVDGNSTQQTRAYDGIAAARANLSRENA